MKSFLEIYRRFFSGLKLFMFLGLLLVAAEASVPFLVAAMGRFAVDEVIQVNLMAPGNRLSPVPSRPLDARTIETGQLAVAPRMELTDSADLLGGSPVVRTADSADRFIIAGQGREEPARVTEDHLLKRGKSRAHKLRLLLIIFAATMAVYVLHSVGKIIHKYILGRVGEQMVYRMRRALHQKLQQLSMSYHDQHEKGRLMARVIDDVDVIRHMLVHLSTILTVNVLTLLIGVAVIFFINVRLSLLALLSLPIFAVVYAALRTRMRRTWRELAKQRAGIYGLVSDRLASPETVKSFGQERREAIRLFTRARQLLGSEIRQIWLGGFLGLWRNIICGVSMALVLGFGMIMVRDGQLSVGYLLFFFSSLGLMYAPVAAISMIVPMVLRLRVSTERVLEVLDEPVTICDHIKAIDVPSVAGQISLKNIWLRYEKSEEPALKDINLTIDPGQRVCLMGPSGSGKTSLVNLLLRLYEPTYGTAHLDGRDLRQISLPSLRRHTAYVPQDAFLFSGTIADNIRYGNLLASDDQVLHAAKAAELHEFVSTLPNAYNTIVGERGITLSGGQRQRVSLARALLTDPRVLILDDCTSALDAITEARIIRTLRGALAGRTTVMITHRVSMSSRADAVIVLKDGLVAEVGSHEELLAAQGLYFDLVAEQLAETDLKAKSQQVLSAAG